MCSSYDVDSYERAVFYEKGEYQNQMLQEVKKLLISDDSYETLLDLGAGTGNFSQLLAESLGIEISNVVCVEPQIEFQKHILERGMSHIHLDATSYCKNANQDMFDVLLLKEMIHLVNEQDRQTVFKGLYTLLRQNGKIVLVARPNYTKLLFFPEAHKTFEKGTLPITYYSKMMQDTGFTDVVVHDIPFKFSISKTKWLTMLKTRFWSNLFPFSEEELNNGCQWVDENFSPNDDGLMEMEDLVSFVVASKK